MMLKSRETRILHHLTRILIITYNRKKAVYLIIAATCWTIWRIRNDANFRSKTSQISRAVGDIKALSFL
ncbi:hypothetical protein HanIR_Chr12g0572071 [Helianthus annuus]|nr:hypothetical protein HanIR_Chr12g0572071 [Helianthus annuus]